MLKRLAVVYGLSVLFAASIGAQTLSTTLGDSVIVLASGSIVPTATGIALAKSPELPCLSGHHCAYGLFRHVAGRLNYDHRRACSGRSLTRNHFLPAWDRYRDADHGKHQRAGGRCGNLCCGLEVSCANRSLEPDGAPEHHSACGRLYGWHRRDERDVQSCWG